MSLSELYPGRVVPHSLNFFHYVLLPTNPVAMVSRTLMFEVLCPFKYAILNRLVQANSLAQLCFIELKYCLRRSHWFRFETMDSAFFISCMDFFWLNFYGRKKVSDVWNNKKNCLSSWNKICSVDIIIMQSIVQDKKKLAGLC